MRIVGGKYKGRIFTPDKRFSSRPTTDLAKEALFNILSNRYDFSILKVLDLFSGTGSIGYEFISRGAESVTSVEVNQRHILFIREVTEKLGINNIKIIREDAFRFLKNCRERFDIVFADPPYDLSRLGEIPEAVFQSGVLNEHGLFILEHAKNFDFSGNPHFTELRHYGKVHFSFFIVFPF
jgi:16S rRNA (guanine966-N2)-methyltransferase